MNRDRSGQAMLESIIVILVVLLLLFGLLQTAIVYTGQEMLHHAAARGARARAVGFNDWMVVKAINVASIPNAGELLEPIVEPDVVTFEGMSVGEAWDEAVSTKRTRTSLTTLIETARIPQYLDSDNSGRAEYILNYREWERGSFSRHISENGGENGVVRVQVNQRFPLNMPFSRIFYLFRNVRDEEGVTRIDLAGEAVVGNHSALYLE